MKKRHLFSFIIVFIVLLNAQSQEVGYSNSERVIFERFQEFFDAEIRRQGIKGNWIFRLNEITGTHKFDFDDDSFIDTLLEFTAVPAEGGGIMNKYVVLFRNLGDADLKTMNYLATDGLVFDRFVAPFFMFKEVQHLNSDRRQQFVWKNRKFVRVQE